MSFRRPKRSPHRALRHSLSTALVSDIDQAGRRRNRFSRRPMRASRPTPCLLPSGTGTSGKGEEISSSYTVTTYLSLESLSGSDTEYSEYDLVNEQMQDFLLDSDYTSDSDVGEKDWMSVGAFFMSGFMPSRAGDAPHAHAWRRTTRADRRRMAKKSGSCASLSTTARLSPGASTAMRSERDATVREAVPMGGASQRRSTRKQERAMASVERRWLVPALSTILVEQADDGEPQRRQLPWFTVVFDLDETLVGARFGPIHLRPCVGELLRSLHRLPVEIVVWTAGTAEYVNPILQAIGQACGRRQWFHHIISRHKRWYRGANTSVKDLSHLGRPLDRLVMVENNPISALSQPSLCVLLEDYLRPNPADASLVVLKEVFERVALQFAKESLTASDTDTLEHVSEENCSGQRRTHSSSNGLHGSLTVITTAPPPSTRPSLALLIRDDIAVQGAEFRVEDILNEDGVSMLQRVEMKELVGGANTLRCLCLRYTPPLLSSSSAAAPTGAAASTRSASMSLRSYGSVSPLPPL
ncbi:hypothetical protein LSCM1_02421 [Leishmania martiniquensis]|uniref:Mitochondrial import inner membrane translocase subunit TIM50 n=1 Tax=Leishmania martiniquensis TaxID=1580590 RepID=A0A836KCA8_9TRYP|nr:hypothetical protein LSCM1_02421 [Leishmania martiniquensis]